MPTLDSTPASEVRESRRERKARETRRRILNAALGLFAEHGPDGVTIEEIADRADVARGTVFNHFASKESLCQCVGEAHLERLQEALAAGKLAGAGAREKINSALLFLAEMPGLNPEHARTMMVRVLTALKPGELPEHRRRLWAMVREWVEEGQRSGELRADVPAQDLAGFILGLNFQATLIWAYGFVPGTLAEMQEAMLRLGFEGVLARPTPESA